MARRRNRYPSPLDPQARSRPSILERDKIIPALIGMLAVIPFSLLGAYLVSVSTANLESSIEGFIVSNFGLLVDFFRFFIGLLLINNITPFISIGLTVLILVIINMVVTIAQNKIGRSVGDSVAWVREFVILALILVKYALATCCAVAIVVIIDQLSGNPERITTLGLQLNQTGLQNLPIGALFPLFYAVLRYVAALEDGVVYQKKRSRWKTRHRSWVKEKRPDLLENYIEEEPYNDIMHNLGADFTLIIIAIAIFAVTCTISLGYPIFLVFEGLMARGGDWIVSRFFPGRYDLRQQTS